MQQRLKALEDNGGVKRTGSQKQSVEEGEDQAMEACKRQKMEVDWLRQVQYGASTLTNSARTGWRCLASVLKC